MSKKKLSIKEDRFITEYMKDGNGARAAEDAGYAKNSARQTAYDLLTKPYIQDEIQRRWKKVTDKAEITQERVLKEMGRLAFSDLRNYYDEDGNLIPICDLSDDAAAAISGVDQCIVKKQDFKDAVTKGTIETDAVDKIKLHPKIPALDMLNKKFGTYEKDNKQKEVNVTIIENYTAGGDDSGK